MPKNRIRELLDANYAIRSRRLHAVVTSAPVDSTGRSKGYVTAIVAGQPNVQVMVDRNAPSYVSYDEIEVEQIGDAANAVYYATRRTGGARPDSINTQFLEDTTIQGRTYAAGDSVMGFLSGGSPNVVVTGSQFSVRDGTTDKIALNTNASSILVGETTACKPNVYILPTQVTLRAGLTERIRLDESGSGFVANQKIKWDAVGNASIMGHTEMTSGCFSGSVGLGTNGGIYQGTGTFATPTTGLKLWNDGGVGRVVGFYGGASQAGFGTDGRLYGGGGLAWIDASGVRMNAEVAARNSVAWVHSDSTSAMGISGFHSGTTHMLLVEALSTDGEVCDLYLSAGSIINPNQVEIYGACTLSYMEMTVYGRTPARFSLVGGASANGMGLSLGTGDDPVSRLDISGCITVSDDIICSGSLSTDGGTTGWDLGAYTATPETSTGYISVVINGVTYRLLAAS